MREFIKRIIVALVPIIVIGIICLYYKYSIEPNLTGGLGELGKIEFGIDYDERMSVPLFTDYRVYDWPEINFNDAELLKPYGYSIFTIGDSFSQQGINGYQNILAHQLDTAILNIKFDRLNYKFYGSDAEQLAVSLLNSGFFDGLEGSTIIIESVERYFVNRILKLDMGSAFVEEDSRPINESRMNWQKAFADWLKLKLGITENPVKKARLNKRFFSHPVFGSELFFYFGDLEKTDIAKDEYVVLMSNLQKLYDKFNVKGLRLVYVIVPDKYDVYEDYIIDNPFGNKVTKDYIFQIQKSYNWVVFPLNELKAALRNNDEDLYYAHDTHWSYKGATILSTLIQNKINLMHEEDQTK